MREINFSDTKERKERPKNDKGEELVKGIECVGCKNIFTCKGKPRHVKACVNFDERTK